LAAISRVVYKETDGEKGRCPMCSEENEINVVLKLYETQRWHETFWNNTRLHINPETAHQTIISYIKITEF
jgi:hypothetical protein